MNKPTYEQLQAQVKQLAAENARFKFEVSRCHQTVDEMFNHREKWVDKEWLSALWSTSKRIMDETPATDAILASMRAEGVEMFVEKCSEKSKHALSSDTRDSWWLCGEHASDFAAQLRSKSEVQS